MKIVLPASLKYGHPGKFPALILLSILLPAVNSFTIATTAAQNNGTPACRDCNIILISLDTLRADSLGTYGYHRATSPNIDRLAAKGAVFLNAYAQAPHTFSSHISMLTSQYPWTHQTAIVMKDGLAADTVTLPMLLKVQGYRTVWAATMDDTALPLDAGFKRGFDEFITPKWYHDDNPNTVFAWLKENKNRKFFMFLHTYRIHDPYLPDAKSLLRILKQVPSTYVSRRDLQAMAADTPTDWRHIFPENIVQEQPEIISASDSILMRRRREIDVVFKKLFWRRFNRHSEQSLRDLKALYDANILEADAAIGQLYRKLKKLGLESKTMLIITADHGEEFMEHGKIRHTQLYQETLHVPLIFILPGQRQGRRVRNITQSIDISPTVLAAVGAPVNVNAEGRSLLPLIQGEASGIYDTMTFAAWYGSYSVRDSRYTYLAKNNCAGAPVFVYPNATCMTEEFYDRASDPGELENIFAANRSAAGEFAALLLDKVKAANKRPENPWPKEIPEDTRQNILKTGYW